MNDSCTCALQGLRGNAGVVLTPSRPPALPTHPAEISFATLTEDMALAEDYLKYCTRYVLDHCRADLAFFEATFEKGLIARLENVVNEPFKVRRAPAGGMPAWETRIVAACPLRCTGCGSWLAGGRACAPQTSVAAWSQRPSS